MANTPRIDNLESQDNLILNSNFDSWVEATSFPTIASLTYFADLFRYYKNGTMVHTVSRSTDVPNVKSTYSALLAVTTAQASLSAGDYTTINGTIEGYDFQPLAGETFSVSFKVKASKVGTYCFSVCNDGATRSYVVEYQVTQANVWETKTITITHDATGTWNYTNGIGLAFRWCLGSGTTFQTSPNTWTTGNLFATANQVNAVDSTLNTFQIAQVMLARGSNIGGLSSRRKKLSR